MGIECCSSENASITPVGTPGTIQNSRNNSEAFNRDQQGDIGGKINEVKRIITKGKPYIDTSFPRELTSIYDTYDSDLPVAQREAYQTIVWKRASEIYPQCQVFNTSRGL